MGGYCLTEQEEEGSLQLHCFFVCFVFVVVPWPWCWASVGRWFGPELWLSWFSCSSLPTKPRRSPTPRRCFVHGNPQSAISSTEPGTHPPRLRRRFFSIPDPSSAVLRYCFVEQSINPLQSCCCCDSYHDSLSFLSRWCHCCCEGFLFLVLGWVLLLGVGGSIKNRKFFCFLCVVFGLRLMRCGGERWFVSSSVSVAGMFLVSIQFAAEPPEKPFD